MFLIENSTDIEAMQLQSQGSCSSNDHPPAAKKRKTLGSLFKDNEEERDEMPVISKEQCINNETPTVRGLAADKKKQIVHGNYDLLME